MTDRPIRDIINDWCNYLNMPQPQPLDFTVDPEDLPEDIRDSVIWIRRVLELKGIDPSTVYPIGYEDPCKTDSDEYTITFNYDYYKE